MTAPPGLATRPTADRIKESLFNILGGRIQAEQVLDLFAGSGALGIEALSRGAARAVFIDQSQAALTAIRGNIQTLGLDDRTRLIKWNISNGLNCLASTPTAFDLVFMDPPYETQSVGPALKALVRCGAMAPGARIIIEHSVRESLPPIPPLTIADQRRFGKTLVSFMDNML